MRDRRFVAVHRGGPLDLATHRRLAKWAAGCAEHVLSLFKQHSSDDRPQHAIEMARAWSRGEVSAGDARKASVAAHAAAREVKSKAATAVARAAGHAVATAHMAEHCLGASMYALKAVKAAGALVEAERAWQLEQLPDDLRDFITSALINRFGSISSLARLYRREPPIEHEIDNHTGHRNVQPDRHRPAAKTAMSIPSASKGRNESDDYKWQGDESEQDVRNKNRKINPRD